VRTRFVSHLVPSRVPTQRTTSPFWRTGGAAAASLRPPQQHTGAPSPPGPNPGGGGRQVEVLAEFPLTGRGDLDAPRAGRAAEPSELEEPVRERCAESTGEVWPPLAPVKAGACEGSARGPRSVYVEAESQEPHSSMPTSRLRPPLPRRTSSDPRRRSKSRSATASASWSHSPARHQTHDHRASLWPWHSSPVWRIAATISSTVGGSAG
jgi:hypothetical protein